MYKNKCMTTKGYWPELRDNIPCVVAVLKVLSGYFRIGHPKLLRNQNCEERSALMNQQTNYVPVRSCNTMLLSCVTAGLQYLGTYRGSVTCGCIQDNLKHFKTTQRPTGWHIHPLNNLQEYSMWLRLRQLEACTNSTKSPLNNNAEVTNSYAELAGGEHPTAYYAGPSLWSATGSTHAHSQGRERGNVHRVARVETRSHWNKMALVQCDLTE